MIKMDGWLMFYGTSTHQCHISAFLRVNAVKMMSQNPIIKSRLQQLRKEMDELKDIIQK
jgi:hypothetical protein